MAINVTNNFQITVIRQRLLNNQLKYNVETLSCTANTNIHIHMCVIGYSETVKYLFMASFRSLYLLQKVYMTKYTSTINKPKDIEWNIS